MILTGSSSRNCERTFIIGRGFAERQILKKWKWPYLWNWVKYFDKLLRKHWYWQDLAQEIGKWHFSSVKALPSFNFWKKWLWRYLLNWVEYCDHNFAYTLILTRCNPWDCQMAFEIGWVFAEVHFWKKSETIAKWHLSSVEALPRAKFWKSENGLIFWTEWNILIA